MCFVFNNYVHINPRPRIMPNSHIWLNRAKFTYVVKPRSRPGLNLV